MPLVFLDRLIKNSVFLSFNFYGYIHFDVLLTSTFSALFINYIRVIHLVNVIVDQI